MYQVLFGLCGRLILLAVLLGAAKAQADPQPACAHQAELTIWRRAVGPGVILSEVTDAICFPVSMMCWRARARLGPRAMTCRPAGMGYDA